MGNRALKKIILAIKNNSKPTVQGCRNGLTDEKKQNHNLGSNNMASKKQGKNAKFSVLFFSSENYKENRVDFNTKVVEN